MRATTPAACWVINMPTGDTSQLKSYKSLLLWPCTCGSPDVGCNTFHNLFQKACPTEELLSNFHTWSYGDSKHLWNYFMWGWTSTFHSMGSLSGSSTRIARRSWYHSFCGHNGAIRIMERFSESVTLNKTCQKGTNGRTEYCIYLDCSRGTGRNFVSILWNLEQEPYKWEALCSPLSQTGRQKVDGTPCRVVEPIGKKGLFFGITWSGWLRQSARMFFFCYVSCWDRSMCNSDHSTMSCESLHMSRDKVPPCFFNYATKVLLLLMRTISSSMILSLKSSKANCTAFISKTLICGSFSFEVHAPAAVKFCWCASKPVCDAIVYRRGDEGDKEWDSGTPSLFLPPSYDAWKALLQKGACDVPAGNEMILLWPTSHPGSEAAGSLSSDPIPTSERIL